MHIGASCIDLIQKKASAGTKDFKLISTYKVLAKVVTVRL